MLLIRQLGLFLKFIFWWCNLLRRHLKIILFPVERPGEFILGLHPAAIFFFFKWKIVTINVGKGAAIAAK